MSLSVSCRHNRSCRNMSGNTSNQKRERKRNPFVSLPLAKVTVIMKSSPDVGPIGADAVLLTAKAAELFVTHLAKTALQKSGNKKTLDYKQIADVVNSEESFAFLKDVIPHRMPVHTFRKILQRVEEKEEQLGRYLTQKELDAVRHMGDEEDEEEMDDSDE